MSTIKIEMGMLTASAIFYNTESLQKWTIRHEMAKLNCIVL